MTRTLSRKADERRQSILDAAAACFREKGLRATSIAEVCKAAGVSAGHLYYYFDSKEALVEAIVEQLTAHSQATLQHIIDAVDPLAALVDHQFSLPRPEPLFGLDDAVELDLYAEAARNPRIRVLLQDLYGRSQQWVGRVLEAAKAKGCIAPQVDPDAVAAVLCLTMTNVSSLRTADPAFDAARYRDALLAVLEVVRR